MEVQSGGDDSRPPTGFVKDDFVSARVEVSDPRYQSAMFYHAAVRRVWNSQFWDDFEEGLNPEGQ